MTVLIITDFIYGISPWFYAIAVVMYSLLLFYGSYFIQSGFYVPVTCVGETKQKQVALTFDDGPVELKTEAILDTLQKNNIQASFFCIGNRMKNYPALVKRMNNEGHLVGNHSFSHHFFFDLFPGKKMREELKDTNLAAEEIINLSPRLFRPPYGVTTPVLAKVITQSQMQPIGWSLRSMDTVTKDENKLIEKITKKIKAGDIILLHDTATVTVNSLQKIIDVIRQKGLEPVRLDQLLNIKAYV
jgi:peptidoglycan/xylan/chitin deacetylase (PgdA/CDA1 family)